MSTEIAAHEYQPVATLMDAGKTLEEALAIVRKQPPARQDRPRRAKITKTTQDTYTADNAAPDGTQTPTRSKYGNVKTVVDDILFDSRAEMRRYQHLKLLQERGVIADLELQPVFTLHAPTPKGELKFIGRYTADFAYRVVETGEVRTEDVKGGDATKTQLYRWKRKHVEFEYDITIDEVQ